MMREILFRGKRIDNGEWVYGYYVPACFGRFPCRPAIVPEPNGEWRPIEVNPETVVQFTGWSDKNGRKIFEGDIVKFPYGTKSMNGKIEYSEEDCIYYLTYKTGRVPFGVFFNDFELEIIGNIHDNPELLEVTE